MDYTEAQAAFFAPRDGAAPPPGTAEWGSPGRRLREAIEPIATICFWSEPAYDAYAGVGLDFLGGYVWGRACVLGEPEPGVVASAFGVFEPGLIADLYTAARQTCSLADVRAAKATGAVTALRHVLGDVDVTTVLEVVHRAALAADSTGRTLHSGLASLPWPQDPLAALWHACSILREHRGDGHLAACVAAGLTGLEANLLTEALVGWEPLSYTGSRAWPVEAMREAAAALRTRGLLTADSALTPPGRSLREDLETATDTSVRTAIEAAGPELDAAITRLGDWSQRIVAAGWFPPDPYKRASG